MEIIGTAEAAKRLGVSTRRVVAMIKAGKLPSQRVGRDHLIEAAALAEVKTYGKAGQPRKDQPTLKAICEAHHEAGHRVAARILNLDLGASVLPDDKEQIEKLSLYHLAGFIAGIHAAATGRSPDRVGCDSADYESASDYAEQLATGRRLKPRVIFDRLWKKASRLIDQNEAAVKQEAEALLAAQKPAPEGDRGPENGKSRGRAVTPQRGWQRATAQAGAVASAVKYLAKEGKPTSAEAIVDFLEGIPGFTENGVAMLLAELKSSGEYNRIIREAQEEQEGLVSQRHREANDDHGSFSL